MSGATRVLLRAATRAALCALLLSANCRGSFCSGDCDDEEDDDGAGAQTILLLPLPLGGPTRPLALPLDLPAR